jgi:hypothetical protein
VDRDAKRAVPAFAAGLFALMSNGMALLGECHERVKTADDRALDIAHAVDDDPLDRRINRRAVLNVGI